MKRIIKYIKENKINLIIISIYAIITLIMILFFHEQWKDEAQSWLIARDLNFIDFIKQLNYEGHPPLWYLILMPFAKLGFPYITENIISWIFMVAANYYLLKKSPFPLLGKILVIISSPSLYFFSIISRSYSLLPLLLFMLASTYKNRHKHKYKYCLIHILLAYTHIFMLGLVCPMLLVFGIEELLLVYKKKEKLSKIIPPLLISFILLVIMALILYGGTENNTILEANRSLNIISILIALINEFKSIVINSYFVTFLVILLLVLLFIKYIKKYPKEIIFVSLELIWLFFISYFIITFSIQKSATYAIVIIFGLWLLLENNKKLLSKETIIKYLIVVIALFNYISGLIFFVDDFNNYFSNSKETSSFINKNTSEDSIFVCTYTYDCTSLVPLTNRKFYNPKNNNYFTYFKETNDFNIDMKANEVLDTIYNNFSNDNIYLIVSPINYNKGYELLEKDNTIKLIYESNKNNTVTENYLIYEIEGYNYTKK